MGTEIKDIITQNITRRTGRVTQVGFGTALLLGPVSVFSERARTYSDPSEMLTDGFLATDNLYKAAVSLQTQENVSEQFIVGRKLENVNAKYAFTFSAIPDAGSYTLTVGVETTASITFSGLAAAIKSALELLTAVTEVTVVGDAVTAGGFTVEFTGADVNTDFGDLSITPSATFKAAGVNVVATAATNQYGSAVETLTSAYNAVDAFNPAWYCLISATRVKAEIKELAALVQLDEKIYIACSDDADVKTAVSTDVASELNALSYSRTAFLWKGDEGVYPEAGWAGGRLPVNPGKSTWKFKNIVGSVADVLTDTEVVNLLGKKANFYEEVSSGTSIISSEATMASGEFIDVIRGIDWLGIRIQERLIDLLINVDKLPITEQGIASVESEIRAQLMIASSDDFPVLIRSTIFVTVPKVSGITDADKAIRFINNIKYGGDLQGAAQKLGLFGTISL